MMTVERDVAVIRATCATKDDIAMLVDRLDQQRAELTLRMNQQCGELTLRIDKQCGELSLRMDQQRDELLRRIDRQSEQMHQQHVVVLEKIAQLSDSMKDGQTEMYRTLGGWAWRLYGLIGLAMSVAYFIARTVH